MRDLAKKDLKESTKCHYQKTVQTLFKWMREARNRDVEWEPSIEYSDPSTTYQPREYLTQSDRKKMREAAMSYGSVPHYNSLSPEERSRWKKHLAQRLQKPKEEVNCPFCGAENESQYSECRTCGRPLSLREESEKEEKQAVLERLSELEEKGVLDKLEKLEGLNG